VNILLTGGSSFTGLWFAKALAAAGHQVTAPLKRPLADYAGLRGRRVAALGEIAEVVDDCAFGSDRFLDLAGSAAWDLWCQHAATTGDYRSPDFDVLGAVEANTRNLPQLLQTLSSRGLGGVVLTGSVFEPDEGAGSAPARAFSPYGLSKGLTWQYFRYCSETLGFPLGKFVIANPFGAFEEPRFCNYLVQSWLKGETPSVRTPLYVRDNIPVDLLAAAYADFVVRVPAQRGIVRLNPSYYVESQGAFAMRFAAELRERLGLPCPIQLSPQSEFGEPMVRINTDRIDGAAHGWSEAAAWDALADFYRQQRV